MPIVLPSSMESRITRRDTSIHGKPLSTPKRPISIVRRLRLDMELPHSDMLTSRPSLTRFGRLEAVRTDHRKRIGSMPQNSCDPAPVEPILGDDGCPKCGVEMEPIEIAVEGLAVEQLRLCPGCYLVTWIDRDEYHVRQGVSNEKRLSFWRRTRVVGWPTGGMLTAHCALRLLKSGCNHESGF
jgi:hypothetical protein